MIIRTPEVIEDGHKVIVRTLVDYKNRQEKVWFSVYSENKEWLTPETQDAFVLALLLLAMKEKEDLYIEGAMSEKLFYNVVNHYMPIIISCIPSLSRIRIIPEELRSTIYAQTKGGVATGFSGGIDSFCVLADHLFGSVPDGFRVTHLLFNNVGSHGAGGSRLFWDRYSRLLPAAEELGLPFIAIDSNLGELLPFGYQLTCTIRNISAVLLLQKLIRRFYFASTYKYEDCFVGEAPDMATSDPIAVHLLSTETTECISSGCQYSRVEKTMRVAEIQLSHEYLDVCVDIAGGGNCSVCVKCARTLLTLEIIGKLEEYKGIFNLEKYGKIRNRYISKVLSGKKPLQRELVQLSKELKYDFPFLLKCYSLAYAPLSVWESRKLRGTIPYHIRKIIKNFRLNKK